MSDEKLRKLKKHLRDYHGLYESIPDRKLISNDEMMASFLYVFKDADSKHGLHIKSIDFKETDNL